MPKVYLTDAQRRDARYQRILRELGDGLAILKVRNKLSNKALGHELGINHETVAKVLDGQEVKLNTKVLFQLFDLAGLEIKKKEVNLQP